MHNGHRNISIHAPREGGDEPGNVVATSRLISIHAPREGGDYANLVNSVDLPISIHAPREGGRLKIQGRIYGNSRFQSTPPARGATLFYHDLTGHDMISIHAPREGGDLLLSAVCLDLLVISIHAPREGGD